MKISRKLQAVGITACLLLAAAPALWAQVIDPDLQSVLDDLRPQDKVSVIVYFTDKANLGQIQAEDRASLRSQVVRALKAQASASQNGVAHILANPGNGRRVSLWGINGLAITANSQSIVALAHNLNVERIARDSVVEASVPTTEAITAGGWNLDAIGAPGLWAMQKSGAGVVVAALDSGVDAQHPDLAATYRGGANSWFDPHGEHATPYDRTGHGTQVMGLMVGGSAGGTTIGVAPDSRWIAAKIFNDAGGAPLSAIHQAFQWVLDPDGDPDTDDAADVVNNSWSLGNAGGCDLEFEQDIQVLKAAQIAVVFAGGNYGPSGSTSVSPANNPSGFGVGSVDSSNTIAATSASGPAACGGDTFPEVVAPGEGVRTADLTLGGAFPDSYASASGTSFSAPHVAGGMAVLLSGHPNASVTQLERSLTDTAADLGAGGADNTYGHGIIDLQAADTWLANPPAPVCTDIDGDGFFVDSGCGGELDCNDLDAGINPAACDIKRDGIDQDCDGRDRTKGKGCPDTGGGGDPTPTPTPTATPTPTPTPTPTTGSEGKRDTCSDGIDNDGDGLIDCFDPDCAKNRSCK